MIILDVMAIDTTFEFDGFFFLFPTLTEGKILPRGKVGSMNNSLFEELIENTVECCLVHLT